MYPLSELAIFKLAPIPCPTFLYHSFIELISMPALFHSFISFKYVPLLSARDIKFGFLLKILNINSLIFFAFFSIMISIILYLIFFIPKFEYILIRIVSFFDPSSGNNYQSEKASEAIINGGFFGKGIGEGVLKNKVPEAHTDYIVSIISEEFGTVMIFVLLVIFLFFIYHVFKKLNLIKDNKVKLVIIGSSVIILFQFLIHVGVNIRMFPTTGMTLPFLSYGGSSIVGTAILSGIILNLTKRRINY